MYLRLFPHRKCDVFHRDVFSRNWTLIEPYRNSNSNCEMNETESPTHFRRRWHKKKNYRNICKQSSWVHKRILILILSRMSKCRNFWLSFQRSIFLTIRLSRFIMSRYYTFYIITILQKFYLICARSHYFQIYLSFVITITESAIVKDCGLLLISKINFFQSNVFPRYQEMSFIFIINKSLIL